MAIRPAPGGAAGMRVETGVRRLGGPLLKARMYRVLGQPTWTQPARYCA